MESVPGSSCRAILSRAFPQNAQPRRVLGAPDGANVFSGPISSAPPPLRGENKNKKKRRIPASLPCLICNRRYPLLGSSTWRWFSTENTPRTPVCLIRQRVAQRKLLRAKPFTTGIGRDKVGVE